MKLKLTAGVTDRDPPMFELPKVTVATYASDGFVQASLIGITPAQLHDAIGCTAITFTGERRAAYLRLVAEEMLSALHPCADCDSGAPNIPPHDCTKYAKPSVPTAEIVSAREGYEG